MKRKFFAVLVLLLAVMLATCDLLEPLGEDLPWFTEDGRPMAHITINVGDDSASRSLTTAQAKDPTNGVNYYEVAFKDPVTTTMYRKAWLASAGIQTISVPLSSTPGYDTAQKAILFAGRSTGGGSTGTEPILLAVGIITATTTGGATVTDAVIASNTSAVTFTLTAIEYNVANNGFSILGPSAATSALHTDYRSSATGMSGKTVDVGTSPQLRYPIFYIPESGFANANTLISNTLTNVIGQFTFTVPNFLGVIVESAGWSATSATYPVTSPTAYNGAAITVTEDSVPAAGSALTATSNFQFLIVVPATAAPANNGICSVSIDVPVVAINTTTANSLPATWHIHGGTTTGADGGAQQNQIPNTTPADSSGRAVLLAVGGYELIAPALQPININPVWP